MWVVRTNKAAKVKTDNLLEGLEVFIKECKDAEIQADSKHPRTVDLIQVVTLEDKRVIEYPYFSSSYN